MPRTRSLAWAELKFGLIAVFALVMAGMLIFAVGGSGGFFWQNYSLKVKFDNVAGLMEGSPVRVAGVEVGSVSHVELLPTGVEVWFDVKDDMRPLITDQSTASIGSISLLGEGAVDITAAPHGTPLQDWAYIPSKVAEGSIAQITAQASSSINEARLLVENINKGRGTVGKLFTDDALYRNLDAFVTSSERVVAAINSGKGTMGKLTNDPALYDELHASIANLNAITARIKNGEGSLGQLMTDPAFSKTLTQTTQNFETLTAKLNKGEGTAGKLLNDDALYRRLDSVTARLDTVLQNLNDGQGTAGQLLHDKQLYENMNQTITEMRALITEIKKDPKKYLNVKVSIF
jgi:phospholipid/cholesterol/gamma-HCH transport system substrate-binding protein